MAIKRVTFEIDDSPDRASGTASPPSLIEKKKGLPAETPKTGTPDQQEDYLKPEAIEKGQTSPQTEITGRTLYDLVFTKINQPAFTPTLLTIIAFVISIVRLKTLKDFWIPIIMAIIFNCVWFGIIGVRHLITRKAKNGHCQLTS